MMDRVDDAKKRLEALHKPVPEPTQAALAQNKAEQDSRHSTGMLGSVLAGFKKHPDVAQATHVGDPTLVDPHVTSAKDVVNRATNAMLGNTGAGGGSISAEAKVGTGPPPNEPAPRSDSVQPDNSATQPPAAAGATDSNELKPNASPDSNELKLDSSPAASSSASSSPDNGGQALPPPAQVNEIQNPENAQDSNSSSSSSTTASKKSTSSSKPKKKKGLKKIIPF